MSYSYKCYSDTKDFMKKFVNAEEGAIIYGISKSRIIVIAREAGVFFASTFWTKLQNIFGHYCKSKLDKVAKPRLAAILPAA